MFGMLVITGTRNTQRSMLTMFIHFILYRLLECMNSNTFYFNGDTMIIKLYMLTSTLKVGFTG